MSLHCASPEPARHKAAALSNDRLKNAKVIAENAIKVCMSSVSCDHACLGHWCRIIFVYIICYLFLLHAVLFTFVINLLATMFDYVVLPRTVIVSCIFVFTFLFTMFILLVKFSCIFNFMLRRTLGLQILILTHP